MCNSIKTMKLLEIYLTIYVEKTIQHICRSSPKLACRFVAFSPKSQQDFTEIDKLILKFIWKCKGCGIVKQF